jgi:hypothetical protein
MQINRVNPVFSARGYGILGSDCHVVSRVNLAGAIADPPGTLSTPWNAGFVDMAWITEDFTKGEVQQR